jgi:hypothetical protein
MPDYLFYSSLITVGLFIITNQCPYEKLGTYTSPAFLINNRILFKEIDPYRLRKLYLELTCVKTGLER